MSEATHTPGPWTWADEPGAGIQIRGPYKDSTRLLFSDIWRQFPERKWDAEMEKNAQLAAAAPELLDALIACRAELFLKVSNEHGPKFARHYPEIAAAEAAIAKAIGGAA